MYPSRRMIAGVVASLFVAFFLLTGTVLLAQPLAGGYAADRGIPPTLTSQPRPITRTWLLQLTPPDIPAVDDWTLLVEAYHAARLTRHAAITRRLSVLKTQGVIADFDVVASGAAVVVTVSGAVPQALSVWPEVARITPVDGMALNALDAGVGQWPDTDSLSAAQVTTLTLNLGVHSHLVSGATPNPAPIALRLLRDGAELARATATPFPDGLGSYVYAATLEPVADGHSSDCNPNIQPGDVLEAGQAGQTVTVTVPVLTALADQTTATVYGRTAAGAPLDVYAYRYADNTVVYRRTVTATAGGDYLADFAALTPFAPRDYGYVFFAAGLHRVYARFNVPLVSVGIGANRITGILAPCADVTLDLYDAHLTPLQSTLHGHTTGDGAFSTYLYSYSTVSDTVVVSAAGQTISVTVFDVTAHPAPSYDVITGSAPASATVRVDVYRGPLSSGGYYEGCYLSGEPENSLVTTATLAGVYSADFSDRLDLVAGHFGATYATAPPGGQVYRCFAVPFLRASLGTYRLVGQVNGSGNITVSVWGASGALREVHNLTAYPNGAFQDWGNYDSGMRLLPGDWITVTGPDGVDTGMHASTLTVYIDRTQSLVYGEAPPGSRLRVGVLSYSPKRPDLAGGGLPPETAWPYTLWVTATTTGVYTADFSALTSFAGYGRGEVVYIDPHGYEAYREFSISREPSINVQSGGNRVEGYIGTGASGYTAVQVTLRGADGHVRATDTLRSYGGSFLTHLYTADRQPAIIEPGDTVEVITGDEPSASAPPPVTPFPTPTPAHNHTAAVFDAGRGPAHPETAATVLSVTVPTLTIQADFATDVIYGEAPPYSVLQLSWSDNDTGGLWYAETWHWPVTSTLTGTYHLDVGQTVDLDPAGEFTLTWTDANGNEVWRQYQPPYLALVLGESQVTAYGDVYDTITLTLADAHGVGLYTQTISLGNRTHAPFFLRDQGGGVPLLLEPGYVLDADWGDAVRQLTLPQLTALADADSDVISGTGPPGGRLLADIYTQPGTLRNMPVMVTASGAYTLDLSGVADLTVGSYGFVTYRHPDGHRVARRFGLPTFEVWLGEPYIWGRNYGTWSRPLTVSLYDAGGDRKGRSVLDAGGSSSFSAYLRDDDGAPVAVSGGDRLVVESPGNSTVTYTVPVLTVIYDADAHVLSGIAPAGAWLRVELKRHNRRIPVGATGTYAMDWYDVAPARGTHGTVFCSDAYGNRTHVDFEVPRLRVYLPLVLRAHTP